VQAGDVLIGLSSSGAHSNGYSLIRKIIEVSNSALDMPFDGRTLGEVLLEPTRIYVKSLLSLMQSVPVHALAHITGGGLIGNVPRVLPQGLCAEIDTLSWKQPAIFDWLKAQGNVDSVEMHRTFNCGIGMVVCVGAEHAETALTQLRNSGETAQIIGKIIAHPTESVVLLGL
jgi:phosphoribosylformylglycinamidine cyclo-ligase